MAKPLPVWATLLLLAALAFADGARAAAPAQYEHDAAGRRVALKLPNGVKTTYAHDAAGRLTRIESKNAAGNVISAFGYALDASGNRTALDVTLNGVHNHIAYEFDHAYRLTRETRKDAAGQTLYDEGLTYDPVGNRLTRTRTQHINGQMVTENTNYAYNAANQLLTETTNGVTTAYGYDKNGNNTTISTPATATFPAKAITMTYDWLNRQTRWSDGTRTESTVFAGADWKRASTTVGGAGIAAQTTKYLYDGDNVLADFGNDDALTAFYVTPGLDQNLSVTDASGATAYYTQDGLGSVRLLTSANGAILNRYDYTAFGETFAPNTVTTAPNRYTYTAREQSPLAAHGAPMHYRWRNYAPEVGRFMWRDPIGYEGGVNVYSYCQTNPILMIDSLGLWDYPSPEAMQMMTPSEQYETMRRRAAGESNYLPDSVKAQFSSYSSISRSRDDAASANNGASGTYSLTFVYERTVRSNLAIGTITLNPGWKCLESGKIDHNTIPGSSGALCHANGETGICTVTTEYKTESFGSYVLGWTSLLAGFGGTVGAVAGPGGTVVGAVAGFGVGGVLGAGLGVFIHDNYHGKATIAQKARCKCEGDGKYVLEIDPFETQIEIARNGRWQ